MTTHIYNLPDGHIQVVNDTLPRYQLNDKLPNRNILVMHGKGHYDKTTSTVFIEIFKGVRFPVPILGEVKLYGF